MSDTEPAPTAPSTGSQPSSSAQPHPQQGLVTVQHTSFGAMAGIMPAGKLVTTGNVADNWKVWKQMWNNYMVIAQLETQPPAYKVALFLHCIYRRRSVKDL